MPKIQCHIGKVKLSGLEGMRNHLVHREKCRSNPDIDHSRTKENYFLLDARALVRFVNTKIKREVKRKPRPDAVGLVDIVCGASREYMRNLSKEQQRAFFQDCLSFLSARYGAENIVYAVVHMDESNPHIHIGIVPIRDGKLSAKRIFSPVELRQLQSTIAEDVGTTWGLSRGEIGSGGKRYKELQDFKREATFHKAEPDPRAQEEFERARRAAAYARKIGGLVEDRERVIMPMKEWQRMAKLAQRTAQAEQDRAIERRGRLAAEKAQQEAELERIRVVKTLRDMRDGKQEPDPWSRIPAYFRKIALDALEKLRAKIRDAGDKINRGICRAFLRCGSDFRQAVELSGASLDSVGIPKNRHEGHVRDCLTAAAMQGQGKRSRRGTGWYPRPQETDYGRQLSGEMLQALGIRLQKEMPRER